MSKAVSGISGYVYTATSITVKFTSGTAYRYDVSAAITKATIKKMIKLAEAGSGLNSFITKNEDVKKYGYVDNTLPNSSFKKYG